MVIVDANVLLYAVDRASAHHDRSLTWLDGALAGTEAVGLAWIALLAFIRVGTNASILPSPMSPDEATGQIEAWLGAPAAVVVQPSPRHASLLRGLLRDTGTAGILTFWPSEFSQLRAELRRRHFGLTDETANELLLQLQFAIGAHGAHPF